MRVSAMILRDLRRAWTGGGLLWPVAFFLLVATLFPFAVGPDAALIGRIGGGVIWAAALLAALLPVERLVAPDVEAGVIDQYAVRGVPLALVAFAKTVAHWLGFAPPLMLAAVIAAGLFDLPAATLLRVEAGLLVGTPGLAALAVATSALVTGLRGGGWGRRPRHAAACDPAADFRRGIARHWGGGAETARRGQPVADGGRPLDRRRGDPGRDGLRQDQPWLLSDA